MRIRFEPLHEQHLPAVKDIYDWYIKNSTATFHTEPVQPEELRDFIYIGHALYRSFLIYFDNAIAGYCFLTPYKKRQAYNRTAEVTLYLKPEYCNQGIGKVVINHLESIAREVGLKNLLGIISGDNNGSIALFEKAGYTLCARFKNVGEKFNTILDVVAYQKNFSRLCRLGHYANASRLYLLRY